MNIIELFLDNLNGIGIIRSYDEDTVLYANEHYWAFNRYSDSLEHSKDLTNDKSEWYSYDYFQLIEKTLKQHVKPIFAIENFGDENFVSGRFLIEYQQKKAILTLILNNKGIPLENQIHISQMS